MKFTGIVERRRVARGSKSEHTAVVLVAAGDSHVIRRRGGNAFSDPALEALVGKTLEVEGDVYDGILHMDSWRVL